MQIATDADIIFTRIQTAIHLLKESDVIRLSEQHGIHSEEDQLLHYEDGKIFVPDDKELRMEILHLHHDPPIAGHPGSEKTLALIQQSYTWPGITSLVKEYVSRCE